MTHTELCRAILADLGALPGVVIATNPSGLAHHIDERTGKSFHVPYGWPSQEGGPDLLAVVAPFGRLVGLEVKTGKATITKEQRACHEALRAVGVSVHVVRSVEDARRAISAALAFGEALSGDEGAVLRAIAQRLAMGRRQYGELDVQGDRRSWTKEAAEEALDCAVYLAANLLRETCHFKVTDVGSTKREQGT